MDNQGLQKSVAKIAETLITTQRNLVTVSRSLWAVRTAIRETAPKLWRDVPESLCGTGACIRYNARQPSRMRAGTS
jgi:hypothetical protein